jgi:hypothetical protein
MVAYLEELIVTDRNLVVNSGTFSLGGGGLSRTQTALLNTAAKADLYSRVWNLSRTQTALLNTAAKANLRSRVWNIIQPIWRAPR